MKIVTILGTIPQFIKAETVSREIAKYDNIQEIIVQTRQHFDANKDKIIDLYHNYQFNDNFSVDLYGGGKASEKIVEKLINE